MLILALNFCSKEISHIDICSRKKGKEQKGRVGKYHSNVVSLSIKCLDCTSLAQPGLHLTDKAAISFYWTIGLIVKDKMGSFPSVWDRAVC